MVTIDYFKSLFLGFLLSVSVSKTCSANYACLHLEITIKNNTNQTCYLLTDDLDLEKSQVNPSHDIVFKIQPHQEAPMIELQPTSLWETMWVSKVGLGLVYECGPNAYIRLSSFSVSGCSYDQGKILARVLSSANLKASYNTYPASFMGKQPAKIYWTIE